MNTKRSLNAIAIGFGITLAVALFMSAGYAAPLRAPASPLPTPAPNSYNIPTTTTVSISFNEPISPATVSTTTFAVHAMQTGLLTQTYGVVSATVSLTPTSPFHPGELVQTSATTGLLSILDGQGPTAPTVWQFLAATEGGSGRFINSGHTLGSGGDDIALGDLDGDGDLDAFVAYNNDGGAGLNNKVWLNNGNGTFVDSGQTLGTNWSYGVSLGDLDGDTDLDAFVTNGGPVARANAVWMNNGTGTFSQTQSLGSWVSSQSVLGDVDGDGDLDALVMNTGGNPTGICRNYGSSGFICSGGLPAYVDDVNLGDVDGDGDLDGVFARNDHSYVWLNDGTGSFSDSGQDMGTAGGRSVDLGDLDGDGDLDAFFACHGGNPNEVWVNDGTGIFTDSLQTLGNWNSADVVLGDVDYDGDLDAFVANSDETSGSSTDANRVYLNDGTGVFTDSLQALGNVFNSCVAMGDLDGDGDIDALTSRSERVWLNQNQADLVIVKTVRPSSGLPGDPITYTLVYTNIGPQLATGVVITDVVPITVTGIHAGSVGAVITGTGSVSYTWNVADLAPGTGGIITITGVLSDPLPGNTFYNTASIGGDVVEPITDNNTSSVSFTVDLPTCWATPDDGSTNYYGADGQALRDAVAAASSGATVKVGGTCAGAVGSSGALGVVYINKNLTLRGGYSYGDWSTSDPDTYPTVLDAENAGRVVNVYSGNVTLVNLRLVNGYFSSGAEDGGGGGVINRGTLLISNTVIADSYGRVGGGVFVFDGSTTLHDSQIISNSTSSASTCGGGGVFVYQSTASFLQTGDSLIAYNNVPGNCWGGGIYAYYGDVTMNSGEIVDNDAGLGGGVAMRLPAASFTQVSGTVGYNTAINGGGIYGNEGTLTLLGGQVVSNTADTEGGGVFVGTQQAALTVSGTQVISNTADKGGGISNGAGSAEFVAGLIAGNSATDGGGVYVRDATAVFTQTGGTVTGNSASIGAGIYVYEGSAGLSGGQISGNQASNIGGGIHVTSLPASVLLNGVQILGNTAVSGGGVYVNEGNVTLSAGQISSNTVTGSGGGVYLNNVNSSLLQTGDSLISHNTANGASDSAGGGGVYVSWGIGTLSSGSIEHNSAVRGGGVFVRNGTATLAGQIISNTASLHGGGLHVYQGSATLNGAQALSNTALSGGGVYVGSGTAGLNNVHIEGNQATGTLPNGMGGGVFVSTGDVTMNGGQTLNNTAANYGGGLYNSSGSAVLTETTIASNPSGTHGGGLFVEGGTTTVTSSTIALHETGIHVGGSSAGSLLVRTTVISDNQTAGVHYGTSSSGFAVTLGGEPSAANTFRSNGPGGTVNITVTASSDRLPVYGHYNDWGVNGLAAIEGTLYHQFDSPALARIDYYTLALVAAPIAQIADGASAVVLTSTVGGLLNPIPGDIISFATSLGDLGAPSAATNSNQQASVDLTSTVSGTAHVTSTAQVDVVYAVPVTATVYFGNAAPIAASDTYTTPEDTPLTVLPQGVLENDLDPNGDPLTLTLGTGPAIGVLDLHSDGSFVYSPTLDTSGSVTFTYVISDGEYADTATVTIDVLPVNDPPTISDIPDQQTKAGVPIGPILFTVGDIDDDPSGLGLAAESSIGALIDSFGFGGSGTSRTLTITPTSGLTGTTTITVTVNDGESSAIDTLTLMVGPHRIYLPLVVRQHGPAPRPQVRRSVEQARFPSAE